MQSTEPTPKRQLIILLNYLLTASLLEACLWELRDTTVYRHSLKAKLNSVRQELTGIVERDLRLLDDTDPEAMFGLMEGMEDLMKVLCAVRPENLVGLMHIVRRFNEMPEWTMNMLGVKVLEPEEIVVVDETGKEVCHG
jgi:hypothetical protein